MSSVEEKDIEIALTNAKSEMGLGTSLERLLNNKDFKKIVMTEYLEQEAIRLVQLKADFNMSAPHIQASIIRDIDAIGSFKQFLMRIEQRGEEGRDVASDCEMALEEIRAGEAE